MNLLQKLSVTLTLSLVLLLITFAQVHASSFTFTQTTVKVDNNATVDNVVNTQSNSGGNTQTSNGGSNNGGTGGSTSNSMQTGNAGAQTIICNDVNHTVINANSGQSCPPAVNPTATPAPQPTATPNPGCTSNCGGGSNGGGSSSSNSSGGGSSSGSNQAVLGMASTGTFTENVMNAIAIAGLSFLSLGLIQKMKKTSRVLEFEFSF